MSVCSAMATFAGPQRMQFGSSVCRCEIREAQPFRLITTYTSSSSLPHYRAHLSRRRCVSVLSSSSSNESYGYGMSNSKNYSSSNTSKGGKAFKRLDSCWVTPPPQGKKPSAIIKFLGGAFLGAVPEVTYSYLIERLANDGFIVISVPYNVSFDHTGVAREVYDKFHASLNKLLSSGLPDVNLTPADLVRLPLYSVGHSNGALLQVLTGCYFSEKTPEANVIISYNNRPATEAVPYFEQLGPLVSQVMPIMEASPIFSMASGASGDAQKLLRDVAGAILPNYDPESAISMTRFFDQLPSVFNQVRQGVSEFRPTPAENQIYFEKFYSVKHTLLVKFNSDAIDETDLLERTLKPRVKSRGGTLEKVSLDGNHITPCVQEPTWSVGDLYTPADAIAQGIRTVALNETKALSTTICNWFRNLDRS